MERDKNRNECDFPRDTGYLVSVRTPTSITTAHRGPSLTGNCLEVELLEGVNAFPRLCPAVGHQALGVSAKALSHTPCAEGRQRMYC